MTRKRAVPNGWRVARFSDPILMFGTLFSVLLGVVVGATDQATIGESIGIGLLGTIIVLVADTIVRIERNFEFSAFLRSSPWVLNALSAISESAKTIESEFSSTAVEVEAQRVLNGLRVEFDDLRLGRFRKPASDYDYLIETTRSCQTHLYAVTNVSLGSSGNPDWWRSEVGRKYWAENVAAMSRGVKIYRIFIYRTASSALSDLVNEQVAAGAVVRTVEQTKVRPDLWINFAVWDDRMTWEAQMNAEGTPIANVFSVSRFDTERLFDVYCEVELMASGDHATLTP